MKIIYIHGFLSSSNAQKAQILRRELKKIKEIDFQSVDYPDDLEYSVDYLCKTIESEIEKGERPCLIGSSLGGFLSIILSVRYDLKIALINPCLYPSSWIKKMGYIGKSLTNLDTGESFVVRPEAVDYVESLEKELLRYRKDKTMVLLQSGDEVLDYRYALNFFKDIPVDVESGGSHRYDNFESKIDNILKFFEKK
ncbi:YqiA/YcfP family alpha/beta fold hydrolase [uncultured Succinivibrio sp.]|uniref:YqiA/YcfP family alpha/beta fold hydrolase n=1 Tax=uncultured Succinivibrio sp. TaxID=540749 RepID=UPI0025F5217B|nr:YqiA/YcfP family alpha/beta fold hydrolase [uncultured Succinivibrio sp.]